MLNFPSLDLSDMKNTPKISLEIFHTISFKCGNVVRVIAQKLMSKAIEYHVYVKELQQTKLFYTNGSKMKKKLEWE